MSRPTPDPDDERALFEAAVERLEGGERRMLLEKTGAPRRASEAASGARPEADRRRERGARRGPARLDRRLRAGEEIPLRLDLHGLDRRAALDAVARFVADAPAGSLALIVHGKGSGILREAVREALDRSSRVAEHLAAPPRLGGGGARALRISSRRRARRGG